MSRGIGDMSLPDQVRFWRTQYDTIIVALNEDRLYRTALLDQLRKAEADRDFHIGRAGEYRADLMAFSTPNTPKDEV